MLTDKFYIKIKLQIIIYVDKKVNHLLVTLPKLVTLKNWTILPKIIILYILIYVNIIIKEQ